MIELLKSGQPVMIALGACSIFALSIVLEKLINLRPGKILKHDLVTTLLGLIREGKDQMALGMLRESKGVLANLLRAALENMDSEPEEIRLAVQEAGRQQIPNLERYLPALGTIAGISPLLGLLGTVTGMIKVFNVISAQGVGQAGSLASGISEALITTATGLTLAIPTLVLHQFFLARADRIIISLEGTAFSFVRRLQQIRAARVTPREQQDAADPRKGAVHP